MNISINITYNEAIKSVEAIRNGLDNTPNDIQVESMKLLAEKVFEPLRKALGNKPININSFFRSELVNEQIGGSNTSQHCKGEAMDIDQDGRPGPTNRQIFDYILNKLDFDQLIWEFGDDNNPDWVHVSYKKTGNRKQVLKSYKIGKKTMYDTYK